MNVLGSGISWGFSSNDVLSNSMALFGTIGGFVLLGVAITFAPLLVRLIRYAVTGRQYPEGKNGWQYEGRARDGTVWYSRDKGTAEFRLEVLYDLELQNWDID